MSGSYVVGLDGSEPAKRAAYYAAEQASRSGSKLVLVHIIEWSGYDFMGPEEAAERNKMRDEEIAGSQAEILLPVVEDLSIAAHDIVTIVRHGHAASTLLEVAAEQNASHICLGRKGMSRLKALLFGSTAHAVAQLASVPVTVVP